MKIDQADKHYYLYGTNRVAKDFLYIFDTLEIAGVIPEEGCRESVWLGIPVVTLTDALSDSTAKIIVCGFAKAEKEQELISHGLVRGKDYFFEEDFFGQLNSFHVPTDRKIAVWGAGQVAGEFLPDCPVKVSLIINTNKAEEAFHGIPEVRPDEVADWKEYFVIIAVFRQDEIREKLNSCGLKEDIDYTDFQTVNGQPSAMLRKTIFDRTCYKLACETMLNHLEIFHDGNTRCCCTTFVKQNLSSIMKCPEQELWHSALHKVLALSCVNHTYTFCDHSMCPLFVGISEVTVSDTHVPGIPYDRITEHPETLALGHDFTCNLSCVTCREDFCIAKGRDKERIHAVTEKIRQDYLKNCRFLILAGDGEVFLSEEYKSIYSDPFCEPDYIRILSNGMLFNEKNWKALTAGKHAKIMMTVSIDAASPETYAKIRRGGNFEVLQKNMQYASELKKSGALRYLRFNFVVQRENYQEIPAFVEWGERLGVDEIFFTKILNWGTYTDEEFKKISMMEEDGLTPKKELLDVLSSPVIQNSSIVDLGTIQYSHKDDKKGFVKNYYMWELEKRGGKIFS